MRSRGREQLCGSGAIDQVDDIRVLTDLIERQSELVERLILSSRAFYVRGRQTDGCAVDQQLGGRRRAHRASLELACEHLGALGRAVPHRHLCGTRFAQRPDGGSRAAAGAEHERAQPSRRPSERGDQSRGVGVLGGDRAVGGERERVRGSDLACGVAGCVGERERGVLVRDRDVGAAEPRPPEGRGGLGEQLRRNRQPLVVPVVHPERGEGGVVDRRRAAVRDRPAEDAEAHHHLPACAPVVCPSGYACSSAGARRSFRPPPCTPRCGLRIRRACSENTCSPQPSAPAT